MSLKEARMMTVEILGRDGGWRETEKVHEMFWKIIMGATAAANGACKKEQEGEGVRNNIKILEKVIRNDRVKPLRVALVYHREEKENNWICAIK
jgi:hypothetical protein